MENGNVCTWQTKATAKLLDVYQANDKLKIYKFKIENGWKFKG